MNEEKKLTDEMIELLTEFNEYGYAPTITMPYNYAEAYAKGWKKRLIDLISRLQNKIKQLTEEIDQRRTMMQRMDCNYATELQKNAELQKQVDELLNRRIEPKIFQCHADALENCPKVERAVKDRSKEIYLWLEEKDKRGMAVPFNMVLRQLKEQFGVEVE